MLPECSGPVWLCCGHREARAREGPFPLTSLPQPTPWPTPRPPPLPWLSSQDVPLRVRGDTGPSVKDPISQQGGDPMSGRVRHWPNISLHRALPQRGSWGRQSSDMALDATMWVVGTGGWHGGSLDQHLDPGATPACTPSPLVQHHHQGQVPKPEPLGLCSSLQSPDPHCPPKSPFYWPRLYNAPWSARSGKLGPFPCPPSPQGDGPTA